MPILWTARFEKAFKALDARVQRKVLRALLLLEENPRHPSLRVKPVQGTKEIWEARVDRQYRMTLQFEQDTRIMRNVDSHDECLRRP